MSIPAWWRIIPKYKAPDRFARKFGSRSEAEEILAVIRRRSAYKIVPYDYTGKRLDG
jgi:hypothetical protein